MTPLRPMVSVRRSPIGVVNLMSGTEQTKRSAKAETRLVRPGERLTLPHAVPVDCIEEMRSLEIEREHHISTERWESLRGRDSSREVVTARLRIDERLVAKRLYEVESCCRGRGGNPWACDY